LASLPQFNNRVDVFFRGDDVLVHAEHFTTEWLSICGLPAFRIPRGELGARLAEAVHQAFAGCRSGVPHPTDWKAMLAPVLKVAGVRSWNALAKSSRVCIVEDRGTELALIPTRNGGVTGSNRGFHAIGDRTLSVPVGASHEALLSTLLQAEGFCEVE
jgi:hypothetical protein